MASDRFENTMHDWLAERGAGRAPDSLHASAMTAIGSRRQRVGWWAGVHAGIWNGPTIRGVPAGTQLRLLGALALTLLVGVALGIAVGSRPAVLPTTTQSAHPSPNQTPTHSAQPTGGPAPTPLALSERVPTSTFVEPFTYQLPIEPRPILHLVTEEADIAGFGYGSMPLTGGNYGPFQGESPRGVAVIALTNPWAHCDGNPGVFNPSPSEFLDFLANAVSLGPRTSTFVDGRPATTTSFSPGQYTCGAEFHYNQGPARSSKQLSIANASQLTVFEVGFKTFLIDIWAENDADFETWLPEAQQFVDSIQFEEPAPPNPLQTFATTDFEVPFEFTIPTNYPQWRTDTPELYAFVDSRPGLAGSGGYGSLQASAPRGIAVMAIDKLWVPVCRGSGPSRVQIPSTATDIFKDLGDVSGLAFGPFSHFQVDGRFARSTMVQTKASSCTPEFKFEERTSGLGRDYVATSLPSQFLLVEGADGAVLIDIWAQSDAELEVWLPIATEFVESIHFQEPSQN